MSKRLLSGNPAEPVVVIRTSKTDEVCRYLLYSLSQMIGENTLEVVLYLCPEHVSASESRELDEFIAGDNFLPEQIEEAARLVIAGGRISFDLFRSALLSF